MILARVVGFVMIPVIFTVVLAFLSADTVVFAVLPVVIAVVLAFSTADAGAFIMILAFSSADP